MIEFHKFARNGLISEMKSSLFNFLSSSLVPPVATNIFYTLSFEILLKGIDYTILFMFKLTVNIS